MKKTILGFLGFLIFLFLAGFWVPVQGAWLDRMASEWASRRFGVVIEFEKVSFRGWSHLDFRSLKIQPRLSKNFLKTGAGKIDFRIKRQRIEVGQANLHLYPWLKEPLKADQLKAVVVSKKESLLRIIDCVSDQIKIKGGARLDEKGTLKKVHALVFFPGDSRKFRITLSQNRLMVFKVVGPTTGLRSNQPIFQAQWKSIR
jgi:hypothetical protein